MYIHAHVRAQTSLCFDNAFTKDVPETCECIQDSILINSSLPVLHFADYGLLNCTFEVNCLKNTEVWRKKLGGRGKKQKSNVPLKLLSQVLEFNFFCKMLHYNSEAIFYPGYSNNVDCH